MNSVMAQGASQMLEPYHLFEKFGEKFVYDLTSSTFFHIDEPTYELLGLCLTEPLETAKTRLVNSGAYPREQFDEIAVDIERLRLRGLLGVPDYRVDDQEVERQLAQRYSGAWTKLELALAESCNLACSYCYCRSCPDMPNQGLMSRRIAKRSIEWLFAVTGRRKKTGITLFGGEPLLNRSVFQFVMEYSYKLAREHGKKIRYTMTTNGTLLDDMSIKYIKRHNFGLMVSLDGPPEIHNAQCPFPDGRGSFDAAASGIKALMKRRRAVTVRCTMTNSKPRMLDLIRFFEEFGFTRIVLGRVVSPVNSTALDCDRDTFEDFDRQEEEELLPWMFKQFVKGEKPKYFPYLSFITRENGLNSPPKPRVFKCGACRGTMTVGADGKLYPCHRYVGMSKWVIGHIDEGPDLDMAKEFWRMYDRTVRDQCETCWARLLCNRPCPWEISNGDGTFRQIEGWKCDWRRRFYERAAYVEYRLQKEYPEMYQKLVSPSQPRRDAPRERGRGVGHGQSGACET